MRLSSPADLLPKSLDGPAEYCNHPGINRFANGLNSL